MRISISKLVLACVVIGGAAYTITLLRGYHTVAGFDDKRRQIEQMERENETLQRDIAAKRNYVDDLKQNPEHLKLVVQERLKLVSPGSKNFVVQDGDSANGEANPPAKQPRP